MLLKSLDKAPWLAGLGLLCVVSLVSALPFVRDPEVLAAIERADSDARPPGPPSEDEPPTRANLTPSASASVTVTLPPLPPPTPVTAPTEELDRATTLEALRALEKQYPKDTKVLTKLVRALSGTKTGLHEAVVLSRRLFELAPASASEPELQMVVKRGANGQPATSELALDVMASSMGTVGPDLLFALTQAPGVASNLKARILDLTKTEGVRAAASPALRVALDLRDAGGCERQKLFAEAEKVADKRALQYLTPLQKKSGCGFLKLSDCYPCLGSRVSLGKAISAIQSRAQQQPPPRR